MIRSMTGFASASREDAGDRVSVTVKSVNHRFLDAAVKMPSSLASLEAALRALVTERVTRGRVEISVAVESSAQPARDVALDEALLARVSQAFEAARSRGLVQTGLSASDALRIPGVLEIRSKAVDPGTAPEVLARLLLACATDALTALVTMRSTEGRYLATDIDARLKTMEGMVDRLEALAREGQGQLDARLRERIAALPADLAGDPAALAQEIVRFVARSDVDEEIVRMRGHVEHWRSLSAGPEPCGRKLDFLAQEMNREINTIGSKIEGAAATEIVIAAKAELERIREQVQNVE